ncbi:diguanylate cyclase [Desulfoluna sp.]|uniref:GGDEF domain-containing protein n=1 Tax=Desulfoluna sp. TaxID=2045199 RepID=UPI00260E1E88|nr:diguanylate cyclase [Desulfoluna sp.]
MTELNHLCEFKNAKLEKQFKDYQWPYLQERLRFIYLITATVYLLAGFGDYYDLGPGLKFTLILSARAFAGLVGIAAIGLLYFNRKASPMHSMALTTYMSIVMITEILELVMKAPLAGTLNITATSFIVFAYYLFSPPSLIAPLIGGLGGSVLYLCAGVFMTQTPFSSMITTILCFCLANISGIYFYFHMETSRRREFSAIAKLKALVETDELTLALSRRKIEEMGDFLMKSAKRFHTPLTALMVDIDHFKQVNDRFGHPAGDRVLVELVHRCKRRLREVDGLGRVGGEEFLIFLPQCNLSQALIAAERLRKTICDTPFQTENEKMQVTISIGAAELNDHHQELSCLVRDADLQLYQAKEKGRNRVYHAAA